MIMPDTPRAPESAAGAIPVLWVVFGVLAFTVVASAFLVFAAFRGHDPEMPADYHWEGAGLEADLARATEARRLGARVTLDFSSSGLLKADVSFVDPGQAIPTAVELRLTHATLPERDRAVRLTGGGEAGRYVARFEALPPGHWLVQVGDGSTWRLRGGLDSPVQATVTLEP